LITSAFLNNRKPSTFPKKESLIFESLGEYIRVLVIIALALISLAYTPAELAQVDQGRIAGTLHDGSGAVIAGVTVTVTNGRTGEERTALTNDPV
jgi:hypothetical protein